MSTEITHTLNARFNDYAVPFMTYRGQPVCIARDVGRALDYSSDGKQLISLLRDEWAEELEEGKDFVVISGEVLADLKEVLKGVRYYRTPFEGGVPSDGPRVPDDEDADPNSLKGAKAATLLTESGLNLVAILSRKPVGRKLRRWLADEVLPQLRRTGRYEAPSAPPRPGLREQVLEHLDLAERLDAIGATSEATSLRGRAARILAPHAEAAVRQSSPSPLQARRIHPGQVTYQLGPTRDPIFARPAPQELRDWLAQVAGALSDAAPARGREWLDRIRAAGLPLPWPSHLSEPINQATLGIKLLRLVGTRVTVGDQTKVLVCDRQGMRSNVYWFEDEAPAP